MGGYNADMGGRSTSQQRLEMINGSTGGMADFPGVLDVQLRPSGRKLSSWRPCVDGLKEFLMGDHG